MRPKGPSGDKTKIFLALCVLFIVARMLMIHFIDSLLITKGAHTTIDPSFKDHLRLFDYLTIIFFMASILGVIFMIFKYNILEKLFLKYGDKTFVMLMFAIGITSFYATTYLQGGYAFGNMTPQVSAASLLSNELKNNLSYPFYSYYFGCGSPFLQFYPLFGITSIALVNMVLNNPEFSLKIVLFLSNIISAASCFWLIKEITKDNKASLLGALCYSLNYFFLGMIFSLGTSDHIIIALLPFALLFAQRLSLGPDLGKACTLAVILALVWLTHAAYAVFVIFFILVWIFSRRNAEGQSILKKSLFSFLSVFLSIAISSFYLIPAYLESRFTVLGLYTKGGLDTLGLYPVNFSGLLTWGPFHPFDPNASYIGYMPLILALFGLYYIFKNKTPYRMALTLGLILTVIFSLGVNFSIFPGFNPFIGIKNTHRFVIFLVLFLSILASFGVLELVALAERYRLPKYMSISSFILIMILTDLLPMSMQSRYDKTIDEDYVKAYEFIKNIGTKSRVLDTRALGSWLMPRYQIQSPYPLSFEEHPAQGKKHLTVIKRAIKIISSGAITEETREFLVQTFNRFNIGYLITENRIHDSIFKEILSTGKNNIYGFDLRGISMEASVRTLSKDGSIKEMDIDNDLVLNLDIKKDGIYELPFTDYPYLDLSINGARESSKTISDLGFPIVYLKRGTDRIIISAYRSPLRKQTCYLSLIAFILVTVLAVKPKKRVQTCLSTETTRDYYEKDYIERFGSPDPKDIGMKLKLLRPFLEKLPLKERIVIDIGCGTGDILDSIAKDYQCNPVGTDIAYRALAKKSICKHDRIQCDAMALPLKRGHIGLVYFVDLLEHLPDPLAFLRNLRTLSSDILVFVPIESALLSNLICYYRRLVGKPTNLELYGHIHRFNARRIVNMIKLSGFKDLEYKIVCYDDFEMFTSSLGKFLCKISRSVHGLHPVLHRILFGGHTFIAVLKAKDV